MIDDDEDDDQGELRFLARTEDPHTSHEAAEDILGRLTSLRRKVLLCVGKNKRCTDLDINKWCNERFGKRPESSYRHRRTDLVERGLVRACGETHQEGSNRLVWELTEAGQAMYWQVWSE